MLLLRVTLLFLLYISLEGNNTEKLNCKNYIKRIDMQLIHDYVSWRNIKFIIMFNDIFSAECYRNIFKTYLLCFSKSNIFISLQSSSNFINNLKNINMHKPRHKHLIVFFSDNSNYNSTLYLINQVAELVETDNPSYFIITSEDNKYFNKVNFTSLTLRLTTDLVIAFPEGFLPIKFEKLFGSYDETQLCPFDNPTNRSDAFIYENETVVSFNTNQNLTNKNDDVFSHSLIEKGNCSRNHTALFSYCLLQIYKIRKELNASVITHSLGLWDLVSGTKNLLEFLPQEKRLNFQKFPLKFGQRNITELTGTTDNVTEDDYSEEKLMEIANYFEEFFNASVEIIYFQKLGYKEANGEWTDLLKAVFTQEVDLALDRIIKTPERYNDMAFSHKILVSMRNIYIKPQESNELRDIFLVPFSSKLILCVVVTGAIFCIIKFLANYFSDNKKNTFGEAVIWCIGIFTMQGSVWTPKSLSGNIILITSLAFALVIYNSYSAFITSILSVEIDNIRSVDDLLTSNYNIGYIKNSQDEIYLRSMNDTQLQQIYLRGYLHNTVSNVTEGLLKSIRGHYGFFASVNIARKHLQVINSYRCNYNIIEIQILKTKNTIAFPLSKNSPYRKIINLGIVKMYENGIYKYIYSLLVPELPKCNTKTIFRSADLPDLTSAFGILVIGVLMSLALLIGELFWRSKLRIFMFLRKIIFLKR